MELSTELPSVAAGDDDCSDAMLDGSESRCPAAARLRNLVEPPYKEPPATGSRWGGKQPKQIAPSALHTQREAAIIMPLCS